MKKPKTICSTCRKVKKDDCDRCKAKPFENISKSNYSLYNSSKWRKYAHSLRKQFPICVLCEKEGIIKPSEVVDHIIEINKGGDVWDKDNLQCICHKCHNTKSGRNR